MLLSILCCRSMCVFVFKQKTAYEMRISDWSSDVCSSDLAVLLDMGAQGIPVERVAFVDLDVAAAFVAQHCKRVLGQDAAIPERALEAGIVPAFSRQFA